ncbi:MAG: sulfatase [Myxococcota bacterium]|nr:sulfatase [Myxococcota bacterium]
MAFVPFSRARCCILAMLLVACAKDVPHAERGADDRLHGISTRQDASPADSGRASPPVPQAPPGPPSDCNVVLLSIDSLRADMPWTGYPRPIAPSLAALEKLGVDFTRAYAVSSYTSMSLGGLLSGRLPSELNRSGYFFGTYRGDVFFPKLLQKAGVRTMGVMAHMYFKSAGFDQGFDEWSLVPGLTFDPSTDRDITSPGSEELAERLLGAPENDVRRFFFWAHFLDPHDLYMRHAGIDWGNGPRDRYDAEVTFTDRYIAKLLEFIAARSWAARTVIIVTSDHGEEFGEHGMTRHGFEIWETLVRVPLLVVAPGAPPHRIDVPRSDIDLAPTILELFGLPPDPSFEGKSLVNEVYGRAAPPRDVIVDLPMTSDNGKRRAIIRGDQKLTCFDDNYCKLYDVIRDPLERQPLLKGEEYREMKERYHAVTRAIKERAPYACSGECLNGGYRKK